MQPLFRSFFQAGFECSTHRRHDGRRLDLIAATRHDTYAFKDYCAVAAHDLVTVRDGVRWHLIDKGGCYDWSSFLRMLRGALDAGAQPIWDLCHYGWPDDVDIWSAAFVDRFSAFAAATARIVRDASDDVPFYCPINEISYWAWAGGDMAHFNPTARGRGMELKRQLVRASIAAIEAVRGVDGRARFVHADPIIHVESRTPRERGHAAHARAAQFEAWDMLSGRLLPELGGRADYLDIIGMNYYPKNQWVLHGRTIRRGHRRYRPLRDMLAEIHARYGRPQFIAETGAEADERAPWLAYVCDEVFAAQTAGVPIHGICLYPIFDYPGWSDNRHCPTGLFGRADATGQRVLHLEFAQELARQRERGWH